MKKTLTHTARIAQVALTALLVSASGVAAAPAATQIPTLTNDVGQPSAGAGSQLPFRIALLVAGLLIALVTFAAHRRQRVPNRVNRTAARPGPGRSREATSGAAGHQLRPPRQIVGPTPSRL